MVILRPQDAAGHPGPRGHIFSPMDNNDKPRLFLIDAYALIFRAYYALIKMPRTTASGFNTSAIFGFVSSIEELLKKERPTHMAICFDPPGPTFRHEAYEAYKGEREATPEDIRLSIPVIKEIIRAYRIPVLEVAGFEADDVIGTMAAKASAQGYETYMVTPDKDFGQLVTPSVFQYKPAYRGGDFEIRGPEQVCERYSISEPRQVIDILALMGDKSDNIPGCPGVGEKTASRLVATYGGVEGLLADTASLKGALRQKVEMNAEQIRFSRFLATIRTDVPVGAEPADLVRRDEDMDELRRLFRTLEFRTLERRVMERIGTSAEAPAPSPAGAVQGTLFGPDDMPSLPPAPQADVKAVAVTDLTEFAGMMRRAERYAMLTVSEGSADMTAKAEGWAIATSSDKAWFLPVSLPGAAALMAEMLSDPGTLTVTADLKRDYVILCNLLPDSCFVPTSFYDTSLAHYVLDPEMRHSVEMLAMHYLGRHVPDEDELLGKGARRQPFSALSPEALAAWCGAQATALHDLYPLLKAQVQAEGLQSLLADIEFPLAIVLADMERTGVRIDVEALGQAAVAMQGRLAGLESEIHALAGVDFNVGSPAKVGEVLFGHLALDPKAKKTKTGQYSTSEEVLEKLSGSHPVVPKILEYRQVKKLLSTYLTALPGCINPATGKIHTTYNQTVTATGRISSSDPNLQNIPVRDEMGRDIRKAFIPEPGQLFLSADYSQIELRLVADFADDAVMLDAFAHDKDIHAITAAKIYHESLESVTADQRRKAKTANFGILYGISAFGLANRLNIPRSEAKELIDGYFRTFPTIRDYMDRSIEKAREQGYVTTIHGRRRRLSDINSRNPVVRGYAERNAINAPIQGSAADIIKIAMVRIHAEMKERGLRSVMTMQVHDELNFSVVPGELPVMQELVIRQMEAAYRGRVSLAATMGVGADWLEAH